MKTIKVIDSIFLESGKVKCKTTSGKRSQELHLRQGDLDGACSIYSLVMTLMILRVINRKEFDIYLDLDKRFSEGRLVKVITEDNGLYHGGRNYDAIEKLLKGHFRKKVKVDTQSEVKNEEAIAVVEKNLAQNLPTIISIDYRGGAHSIIAIGLEYDAKDRIDKILCIDPWFDSNATSVWNSIIGVGTETKGKYPYSWESYDNKPVNLGETLTIHKR